MSATPHTICPEPGRPPLTFARVLRWIAALLFAVLLAGYLIYNRTFARLGFPPFYVGEMVLGFAIFAALFDFHTVFIRPLKESWPMRFVALFLFYGIVRIAVDAPTRGIDAARDGVMCLYAIAAFLSPWLFAAFNDLFFAFGGRVGSPLPGKIRAQLTSSSGMFLFLAVASALAFQRDWDIFFGATKAPADIKADFMTLSAAVAFVWCANGSLIVMAGARRFFITVRLRAALLPKPETWIRRNALALIAGVLFAYAIWITLAEFYLVLALPTRAIQPAIFFPFALPLFLWFKAARWRKRIVIVATILFAIAGSGLLIYSVEGKAFREKIHALWDSDNKHYITLEGQRAAHSERWRLIFWRRCVDETARTAPLTGLGFGTNLTDLLRDTSDWPMFAESQDAAKYGAPNRHPHSAHVSVFARLGILGLLLWFAILFSTLRKGVQKCLRAEGFDFYAENLILCVWLIYVLAMSFGVVLENPFGGIWFWALTGIILSGRSNTHIQHRSLHEAH